MRDSYKQENADLKKLVQIKSKKHRDQFTLSVKLAEARTIVAERDKEKAERIRGVIQRDQHKLHNYKVYCEPGARNTVDKKALHGSAKRDLQDTTCASHSKQLTVHLGLLGLRNALAHHVGLGFRFDRNAFSFAVMKPSAPGQRRLP